jgi:DNA-binding transcriptional LysR family regulator
MNMEWYRIFLHTARSGNLTRAAEQLYITQPSVSYAIKQMEAELGLSLFHRLSKGVELTVEGKVLLDYVEQAFALLDAGDQKMSALKQLSGGDVHICASGSLFKHVLLPQLNEYRAAYPDVHIRLSHGKTSEIARRLREGLIDCGIVHLPLDDRLLDIKPFRMLQDTFVVGEAYREYSRSAMSAADMVSSLPLLLLSPGSSTRRYVEQWFAAQGVAIETDMELGSVDLLIEFARQGFGAAFITRSFAAEELAGGKLFEIPTIAPIPPRYIGIATRRDIPLSIAASKFVEMLE